MFPVSGPISPGPNLFIIKLLFPLLHVAVFVLKCSLFDKVELLASKLIKLVFHFPDLRFLDLGHRLRRWRDFVECFPKV